MAIEDAVVGHVRELWRYPVKSMAGERLDRSEVATNGFWGDRGWAIHDDVTGEIHNAKRHPALLRCAATYQSPPRPDMIPHVTMTLPDGDIVSSDSPGAAERLSDILGRRVTLRRVRPAADLAYYRRREAGSALLGRLARYRLARRLMEWAMSRGRLAEQLRETFGREANEPLPDLTGLPTSVFEFQTPPGTYFDVFPIHVLTTSSLDLMRRLNPAATWDVRRFRPNVLAETFARTGAVEHGWVGQRVRIGGSVLKGEVLTIRCAMPMHPQTDLPRDPSVLRTIVRDANQCLGLYASVVQGGGVAAGDEVVVSV